MTYFTSDTHFGHANIIKYCGRPFASVEEMDEELIYRWNSTVDPGDTVWHLGDFALVRNDLDRLRGYVERLNGKKLLLLGNHDRLPMKAYRTAGFDDVFRGRLVTITEDDHLVALCHYPPGDRYQPFIGVEWLHGHIHDKPSEGPGVHNISVERTNYAPVTLEEALKL